MELEELKEKIAEVQTSMNALEKRYQKELSALRDAEDSIITKYIREKAKFQEGDRVLHKGDLCLIGWRELNKEKWKIQYRWLRIKKDGTPGSQLSSYSYPEEAFEKIR